MPRNRRDLLEDVPAAGFCFIKDPNESVFLKEEDNPAHQDCCQANIPIRLGSIPKKIIESDPLNRQPLSELAEYFHAQKESIYRRSRREPLGKSYSHGTQFPKHIVEDPNFTYGRKSDAANHLSPIPKDQEYNEWYRKTDPQELEQEKNAQKKINFHYDWRSVSIDPDRYRFGSRHHENTDEHVAILGGKVDSTRIVLRRENNMQEQNRRSHIGEAKCLPTYLRRMDPNHKFGSPLKKSVDWTVEQCLRFDVLSNEDDRIGNKPWKGSAPVRAKAMVHGIISPIRNHQNTTRSCIWPVNLDNDFTEIRDLQEILEIWKQSGLDCTSPTYQEAVHYFTRIPKQNISLSDFMMAYNSNLMSDKSY